MKKGRILALVISLLAIVALVYSTASANLLLDQGGKITIEKKLKIKKPKNKK